MKNIGMNMLWNSFGSLFYWGCQWIITVLAARLSTSYADAGILSLSMSIANALWGIASLDLRTFQVADAQHNRFSDGDFLLNRLLSCGTALILCLGFITISDYSSYERSCVAAFMIVKLSEAFVDVLHGIDQKAWRLDIAGKSFIMRGIASVAFFLIGVLLFHSLLAAIILMGIPMYLIIFFYDYRTCNHEIGIQKQASLRNAIALVRIGLPLAMYATTLNVIGSAPRISIEKILGEEVLGIFASISAPTVLIMQGASYVFNPLVGLFAASWKDRDMAGFRKVFLLCTGAIALISAASILFSVYLGEWALVLLFGESIRPHSHILLPVVITSILTASIWFLACVFSVVEDFSWIAWSTFTSMFVCLLLCDRLVEGYQMLGAVIAAIISLSLEVLLLTVRLFWIVRRYTRESNIT